MKLIKELPEDVKAIALLRQVEQGNVKNENVHLNSIQDAFIWGRTPEDGYIWDQVEYGNYAPFRAFHAKMKAEAEQKETPAPFSPKTGEWVMTEKGKRMFFHTINGVYWCVDNTDEHSFLNNMRHIAIRRVDTISPLPTIQIPISEAKEIIAAAKGCTAEQVEIV